MADSFYRQNIPLFLPLQAGILVTEDPLSPTGRLKGQGSKATHSLEGSAGGGGPHLCPQGSVRATLTQEWFGLILQGNEQSCCRSERTNASVPKTSLLPG